MSSHRTDANGQTSARPQAPPVLPDNIPAVLKSRPQWLVWKYIEEVDRETGEVDYDKPPVNAVTGGPGSSTNPMTWCEFPRAWEAYQSRKYDGMGFVLIDSKKVTDEGLVLVAIDLDKCREPATGTIDSWALDIIHVLDSYTEFSPSGRGIRIFVLGLLPKHGRKKGKYENYQTARYVTVTGQHVEGTPLTVEPRQDELLRVHHGFFGDGKNPEAPKGGGTPANLEDAEIVRRAGSAKNGAKFRRLWSGDGASYNSASEADLALCSYLAFWCGPDPERIADLFSQSGLIRSKWQREDYRQRTIEKALAGRTEFYNPTRTGSHDTNGAGQPKGNQNQSAAESAEPPANLTDVGNGKRLVKRHGADLRHCHPWGKWLVWNGSRWLEDVRGTPRRRAKETVANLYQWAVHQAAEIGKQLEAPSDAGDQR